MIDSRNHLVLCLLLFCVGVALAKPTVGQAQIQADALAAAKQATRFLTDHVSTRGGYLWSYSADLKYREGEGRVTTETIWVQPPATPSVGLAFVSLYEATSDQQFLDAALAAGEALLQGQMRSGGWQAHVEFSPELRKKWAYRIGKASRRAKDQSSLDDDKTQSALRFLIKLDQACQFKNEPIHEAASFGLNALLEKGQFANGGFPQVWTGEPLPGSTTPLKQASFPGQWPRVYPGHNQYWHQPTLNDHLATDVANTLMLAEQVYESQIVLAKRIRGSILRLGDFLIAAQMPDPQPAWAQQYNDDMQPIWARKFEPPAITTSESYSVMGTLMDLYVLTGDDKFLKPIKPALRYLKTCELPDGRVARFYELRSNKPLYMTREYELTYDDQDMPTHYGFQLDSKASKLAKRFVGIQKEYESRNDVVKPRRVSAQKVQQVIESMDERGAWILEQEMRYHNQPGPVIDMKNTVEQLLELADFLHRS